MEKAIDIEMWSLTFNQKEAMSLDTNEVHSSKEFCPVWIIRFECLYVEFWDVVRKLQILSTSPPPPVAPQSCSLARCDLWKARRALFVSEDQKWSEPRRSRESHTLERSGFQSPPLSPWRPWFHWSAVSYCRHFMMMRVGSFLHSTLVTGNSLLQVTNVAY